MKRNRISKKQIRAKTKELAVKGTSATLLTSLVLSSCSQQYDENGYNLVGNIYGKIAINPPIGYGVLEIDESNLSERFLTHMANVQQLISEITSDEAAATSFKNDPDNYIAARGYDLHFEFTSAEKRFLTAFTDPICIQAIQDNDTERFVRHCLSKNYISGISLISTKNADPMHKYFRTAEDFNKYINFVEPVDGKISAERALFVIAGAIIYIAGAVFIYGAVATIAALWVGVETGVGVSSYIQKWIGIKASKTSGQDLTILTKNNFQINTSEVFKVLVKVQAEKLTQDYNESLTGPIQVGDEIIVLSEDDKAEKVELYRKLITATLESEYGL